MTLGSPQAGRRLDVYRARGHRLVGGRHLLAGRILHSGRPSHPGPVPGRHLLRGDVSLAYAGFIMLARSAVHRLPASVWLDGIVTSLAAGAVFCAYPIGDLVLIVISVAALAMVRWRSDPIWWLLGLGAGLFAVADTAYLFGLANDTYTDGGWVDGCGCSG